MSEYTNALRDLAGFIDAHAGLVDHNTVYQNGSELSFFTNGWQSIKQDKREVAALIKALGGSWEKVVIDGDDAIRFKQNDLFGFFGATVYGNRNAICERRVVGTELVTVPAVKASPERVEEREIVEWDCGSLLAPTPERELVGA